jgi:hypothetical protein
MDFSKIQMMPAATSRIQTRKGYHTYDWVAGRVFTHRRGFSVRFNDPADLLAYQAIWGGVPNTRGGSDVVNTLDFDYTM